MDLENAADVAPDIVRSGVFVFAMWGGGGRRRK
jgi:hypothetical protein